MKAPNVENHWFVGGAAPANKAMNLATGLWITRLDDDDTWSIDHIEKLLKFAMDGDYEFVSALYEEERFGKRMVVQGKMMIKCSISLVTNLQPVLCQARVPSYGLKLR